jgi:glyoxylase-like metal-dependent hydrolase (beta-lactamase superfamily II)
MTDSKIDFLAGSPVAGSLDVAWIHGAPSKRAAADPPIQVHHYDAHTVVMRQSKSIHYEAPFLFLLFGNDRALLLDTGATADPGRFPLRMTVDGLIAEWLSRHPRDRYELVVAHTHAHGDHIAGDAQFAGRPDTTVVAHSVESVRHFFGLADWPAQVAPFDLGGRVLEATGSPGHHLAAITVYDAWTGFLLTGDSVLRGRLYVDDHAVFLASVERMVEFASTRPVTHVLGCHIEMTGTPGRDFPIGATYQPDEPPLQLTVDQLTSVLDATAAIGARRGVHVFDDFIIYNEPRTLDWVRLMARGLAAKVTHRRQPAGRQIRRRARG